MTGCGYFFFLYSIYWVCYFSPSSSSFKKLPVHVCFHRDSQPLSSGVDSHYNRPGVAVSILIFCLQRHLQQPSENTPNPIQFGLYCWLGNTKTEVLSLLIKKKKKKNFVSLAVSSSFSKSQPFFLLLSLWSITICMLQSSTQLQLYNLQVLYS